MKSLLTLSTLLLFICRIGTAQNVGIGTTNPQKKLDVNGSVKVADSLVIGGNTPKAKLHINDPGEEEERTILGVLESSISNRPTLLFSQTPISDVNSGMSIEYNGISGINSSRLYFNKTGGDPIMTLKNEDGKVGVGITNPRSNLHILHDASSGINQGLRIENNFGTTDDKWWNIHTQGGSGDLFFYGGDNATSGTIHLAIENDGDVGIGTTNPKSKLHLTDDGIGNERTIVGILEAKTSKRPTLLFSENGNSDIDSGMSIEYNGTGNGAENKLHLNKTGGDSAVTIKNDGNVGIGTTDPLTLVDLRNSTADTITEQLRIWQHNEHGNTTLRFAHGFSNFNNYIMGIDKEDKRFKISPASSFNESLRHNPSLELDTIGRVYLPNLSQQGILKVTSNKRIYAQEYKYEVLSLRIQNFDDRTSIIFPHGAEITSVKWHYVDEQSDKSLKTRIRKVGHLDLTPNTSVSIAAFSSDENGASPDLLKETIILSTPHVVDNTGFYYEIYVEASGSQNNFIHLNSVEISYRVQY